MNGGEDSSRQTTTKTHTVLKLFRGYCATVSFYAIGMLFCSIKVFY